MDKPVVQLAEEAAATSAVAVTKAVAVATPSPANPSDELPYPPEKYPGKTCALCNLGERSQLGQGVMLRIPVNDESMDVPERMQVESSSAPSETPTANSSFEDSASASDSAVVLSNKRLKNGNKFK